MEISSFNLRVYGLLIHEDQLLITHERRGGMLMTKFPGGGLEFGEGLEEGLKREFQEELGIDIEVKDHYYVNEFLQISRFDPTDQLLSFYYLVQTKDPASIPTAEYTEDFEEKQIFEWKSKAQLMKEDFTFPIDQIVIEKLSQTL